MTSEVNTRNGLHFLVQDHLSTSASGAHHFRLMDPDGHHYFGKFQPGTTLGKLRYQNETMAFTHVQDDELEGIVDYVDRDDATHGVILELVEGTDLYAAIEKLLALPVEEKIALLSTVAHHLEGLHSGNIAHGDISLRNVMLKKSYENELHQGTHRRITSKDVLLVDLALASVNSISPYWFFIEQNHGLSGSWIYMPPEMLHSKMSSPAGDMYSFGVLAYILLYGKEPFPMEYGIDHVAYLVKKSYHLPSPPPLDFNGVEELVFHLLNPESRHRPSARETKEKLYEAL
ncbi:protein kinase [Candidatus Woesearchaeota archaeon]|nr:protein kinase [Candidatus Woesearchaeota archaeon]